MHGVRTGLDRFGFLWFNFFSKKKNALFMGRGPINKKKGDIFFETSGPSVSAQIHFLACFKFFLGLIFFWINN